MQNERVFATVNHMDDFNAGNFFRPGDILTLKKDPNNYYDSEAIVVYNMHGRKCGYIANSVHSVARGTHSAGRLYDKIPDEISARVRFVTEDCMIVEIVPDTTVLTE